MPQTTQAGKVYLVGGGAGDPGLLTLRGRQCLERADVVLYDYLVNPQVLAHAPTAELVCLGRHGRDRILDQDEICRRLVELAQSGRTVVRLKGGDPAIFGRLAEEIEALRQADIPLEIVPGVTAASAAATYAGIPLTWREGASAVAFVTGREGSGKESQLDYAALARFPGTLVFYMGVTTAPEWTAGLLAAGLAADTPVACVLRASWPDQQTLYSTLAEVTQEIARRHLRPPALFVVGEAARAGRAVDWFCRRPLSGRTVLVTRPARPADPLASELAELGANVLVQPAIEIGPPADWQPVDRRLAELAQYDWIVFSSVHGVESFFGRLLAIGHDLRRLASARLAAIGPGTAAALGQYHLQADLIPAEYRAESLAAALAADAAGRRFLLVRASRGRDLLATELLQAGAHVDQIVTYSSSDVKQPAAEAVERLAAGQIDWITVTSSAIADSLARLFGPELGRAKLVSISPVTSATLRTAGFEPAAEASEFTTAGVCAAIMAWESAHADDSSPQAE